MHRFLTYLIIGLVATAAAGPVVISVAHALVPLACVVGLVAALLRGVWFFTNRW